MCLSRGRFSRFSRRAAGGPNKEKERDRDQYPALPKFSAGLQSFFGARRETAFNPFELNPHVSGLERIAIGLRRGRGALSRVRAFPHCETPLG